MKPFYAFYSEQAELPIRRTYKIEAVIKGKTYAGFVDASSGATAERQFIARILRTVLKTPNKQIGLEIYKALPHATTFRYRAKPVAVPLPLPVKQQPTQTEFTL